MVEKKEIRKHGVKATKTNHENRCTRKIERNILPVHHGHPCLGIDVAALISLLTAKPDPHWVIRRVAAPLYVSLRPVKPGATDESSSAVE